MLQTDILFKNRHLTDLNPLIAGEQDCESGHKFGPAVRDYTLIHYVLKGKGVLYARGEVFPVLPGQAFMILPGEITVYEADREDPWHYQWIGFDGIVSQAFHTLPPVFSVTGDIFPDMIHRAQNLQTISDPQSLLYNEETAENLQKLEAEKPEDYYEQVYLLYVSSYYPKLEIAEFNTKAPTIHGYYLDLLSRDTEGKFLCLLKDNCYVGFQSGGMQVIYTGNYSQIQSMEAGAAGADTLIYKSFQSNGQTDYLMYAVNIFGGFFLIVVLWLLMMIVVRIVCRIKRYEVAATFGGAAQLVGSFLLWSGGIAALCGFILSFLLDQALVFYGAIGIMALVLVVRTVAFVARQNPAENG